MSRLIPHLFTSFFFALLLAGVTLFPKSNFDTENKTLYKHLVILNRHSAQDLNILSYLKLTNYNCKNLDHNLSKCSFKKAPEMKLNFYEQPPLSQGAGWILYQNLAGTTHLKIQKNQALDEVYSFTSPQSLATFTREHGETLSKDLFKKIRRLKL